MQNKINSCQTDFSFGNNVWRSYKEGIEREWLITNGIGGYANLTVTNSNARSFSGLLNASFGPPADRYTLLANLSETIIFTDSLVNPNAQETRHDLLSLHTISQTLNGQDYLTHFEYDAYPSFTYQIEDLCMTKQIGMVYGENTVTICYDIQNGDNKTTLALTPFFTCKPLGSIITPNDLAFKSKLTEHELILSPKSHPEFRIHFNSSDGQFVNRSLYPVSMAVPTHEYIDGILYDLDIRNGLNMADSYYTPYDIVLTLPPHSRQLFYITCSTQEITADGWDILASMTRRKQELTGQLVSSDSIMKQLAYSADHFIVSRNSTGHRTILAGYPWFLDWGRDTMIAFTGLTLSTRRFDDAKSILLSFVQYIKNGLLPNVFPDHSNAVPQYNTMDASLWYFQAVYQFLQYSDSDDGKTFVKAQIAPYLGDIIRYYESGTDYQIHMDQDGLIAGGSDKDQITWMDVRIGDWVVTPRHGKPVEINALWYNALMFMSTLPTGESSDTYLKMAAKAKLSFQQKFWNSDTNCLNDVIWTDKDGIEHTDASIRPNQIFAVSLPYSILNEEQEKSVVSKVYHDLYTPLGIRSLSNKDPRYKGSYIGPLLKRDAAYHMGTSWGYLTGPFLAAYLKVHHHSDTAVQTALKLITPMLLHMKDGCIGGIAEIFDGDSPCTSRGCYTQAWSVGELLHVYEHELLPYLSI